MKVLDKMNELVGNSATKEQIENWAYMNRITVCNLYLDCEEFESMENFIESWMDENDYFGMDDEFKVWSKFLDSEYIE